MMRLLGAILFLWILFIQVTFAGNVRTVYTDSATIIPINLRMGQSTILRFIEKPKKMVLGNSNYYSVEFIDNDLAIQPLGTVTTNLFVYGVKNVYGFSLKTNQSSSYDDLVQVDLKENEVNSQLKSLEATSSFKEISTPKQSLAVGNELTIILNKISKLQNGDLYLLDFKIENISKFSINLSSFEIMLTRDKTKITPQDFVLQKIVLIHGETTKMRVLISITRKADLSVEAKFKSFNVKQIISRKFL